MFNGLNIILENKLNTTFHISYFLLVDIKKWFVCVIVANVFIQIPAFTWANCFASNYPRIKNFYLKSFSGQAIT